ncbi:bifunctional (p)ppGpp synthetase/guanosine-3',5'-bis(diphosphate) 3'-pyrophosphohydrolase [Geothrix sp. PMB-07]|uniref:RelA/SpoT family protein n=1 Tax=Geothrix sp. PMB-07 TaxID=3068640 RepID=UPI0027425970|nr:bifunctional (p)ppGpp synthetase/guanosine-3',5'-bis(diphosphate) 3'-pyrophosphohydrolase [Geothrix sp. PMB-07]WLT30503.1 bifunctional (p)ppGpp synthetase/guanosine-3',5'-bis(diphosphate) 3'-pyrophosphohydrolase [Geothrix sp. PMB-07]
MAVSGKAPEPILREGEGSACDGDGCLTLEGAFERVKAAFLQHHPNGDIALLHRAFTVGRDMHATQIRKSGEPYFFHPLSVAQSLADWRLDAVSVACAMLHDVVEDTLMTLPQVKAQFGEEIAEIVDGLTKMSKLAFTDKHLLNAENVRKLLVAMGKDVRVLLVKLADRLHNMKTLGVMEEEKRRRISRETLELYAPLANRLGMGVVRLELEDLAFRQLEPNQYESLRNAVEAKRAKLSGTIQEIHGSMQAILRQQGIAAHVYGRIKHLYGIWKKMGTQAKGFEDIHDWLAYRIICPDRASCYTALGLVHGLFKPVPGKFKDYISLPKENGYQSIHTTVLMGSGDLFEVQIRTEEMHVHAEAGIASHWTYKDGRIANRSEINQVSFLRRMVELHQDAQDSRDLVANLRGELTFNRIQVFTPKGDLRSLVENSTPVDFAYAIHTQVGHRCVGAKVNGRIVPLKHTLQNGDRVEILTRPDHKPSRDWLGFVKSAGAKSRIQAFIREEERAHAIVQGKERLEREARSMGVRLDEPEAQAKLEARIAELKLANWEAAYAALGFGRLTVHKLIEPLVPEPERAKPKANTSNLLDSVVVGDTTGILYALAACCKPIWGDEVVGYITRTRGTAIHRADCPQLNTATLHPERRVNVAWGKHGTELYDTEIALTTEDRPGMVAAISEGIQRVGINVQRFHGSATEEGAGLFHIALRVRDRAHLVELMASLRRIRGVYTVERVKGSVFGKVK